MVLFSDNQFKKITMPSDPDFGIESLRQYAVHECLRYRQDLK